MSDEETRTLPSSFVRRTGTAERSERFETPHGALTLAWSNDGYIVAFIVGNAARDFSLCIARRIMQLAPMAGPVKLFIDLTHAESMDPEFRDDVGRLLRSSECLVDGASVAVVKQQMRVAMSTLALRLLDRLRIDDSPNGLAEFLERME